MSTLLLLLAWTEVFLNITSKSRPTTIKVSLKNGCFSLKVDRSVLMNRAVMHWWRLRLTYWRASLQAWAGPRQRQSAASSMIMRTTHWLITTRCMYPIALVTLGSQPSASMDNKVNFLKSTTWKALDQYTRCLLLLQKGSNLARGPPVRTLFLLGLERVPLA